MTLGIGMPGKAGDFLYSVASSRYLSQAHNEKIDFYTSPYCENLRRLMEYQDYTNEFIVPESYKDYWFAWGVQPADMPIPKEKYSNVYQFGYHAFPDRTLPAWFMHSIGLDNINQSCLGMFKYPEVETLNGDYVVIAPRRDLSFEKTFKHFIEICPVPIVQIGGIRETWPGREGDIDITCLDWLETVSWISKAKGFFGIISSQGALAHNFDIPKVFPFHDGWDMRHVVQTPTTLYMPVFEKAGYGKTAEDALEFMGLM
jgi:hypothetical protein